VSQARCSELEEQVEQQQKVIRYLQAQLDGTKQDPQQQRALQEEAARLRQQLAVLQLSAGGGGGGASALQQQVLLLQVCWRAVLCMGPNRGLLRSFYAAADDTHACWLAVCRRRTCRYARS
jgi:hypothetical protein